MGKRLSEADLIARLKGRGYTVKEISAVLGRNNRMVYRVINGERRAPEGWREALAQMWGKVRQRKTKATVEQLRTRVAEPARRTTAAGTAPRLRRGIWTTGRGWATGLVQAQAARAGALALLPGVQMAHSRMWKLAVTLAFKEARRGVDPAVVRGAKWYSPKQVPPISKSRAGRIWHATSRIIPRDLLQALDAQGGTSLSAAIMEHLKDEEIVHYHDVNDAVTEIEQIEMRIWQ